MLEGPLGAGVGNENGGRARERDLPEERKKRRTWDKFRNAGSASHCVRSAAWKEKMHPLRRDYQRRAGAKGYDGRGEQQGTGCGDTVRNPRLQCPIQ